MTSSNDKKQALDAFYEVLCCTSNDNQLNELLQQSAACLEDNVLLQDVASDMIRKGIAVCLKQPHPDFKRFFILRALAFSSSFREQVLSTIPEHRRKGLVQAWSSKLPEMFVCLLEGRAHGCFKDAATDVQSFVHEVLDYLYCV